jgi:hypothetical protein
MCSKPEKSARTLFSKCLPPNYIKTKSVVLSPLANCTDRAIAAGQRIEGVTWSTQRVPSIVTSIF